MSYISISKYIPILSRYLLGYAFFAFIIVPISRANYLYTAEYESAANQNSQISDVSMLDGKSFSGELGLRGKTASATDLLVFNAGMFTSKGCERRCGYTSAKYYVSTKEERIYVVSETPCLKSDATILWQGTVKGDEIEGTFTWKNKRWYWTFEKEFWFKGKLIESVAAER